VDVLTTSAVAGAYAGGLLGLHRWNVWRLRAAAQGFAALRALDAEFLDAAADEALNGWRQAAPTAPADVFEELRAQATTAGRLYLREHVRLTQLTTFFNLELAVFSAKRALGAGLRKHGDVPALYYARALASSLVGLNRPAIDDLARAVYYSQQAAFYVRAVLDTPYIEEVRPALVYQCRSESLRGRTAAE